MAHKITRFAFFISAVRRIASADFSSARRYSAVTHAKKEKS